MRVSKRDELVQKALTIFYRDGYHKTGMDTLVKETGISKTSMYKHFRTKEDLILATLRLRDEVFRNHFVRRVEELAKTPKDQLIAIFDVLREWFVSDEFSGCMFVKASGEYPDASTPILSIAREHKKLLFNYTRSLAEAANAKDPDLLAGQLMILKEGATVLAHINGASTYSETAKQAAQALIDSHLEK
ncbi:TetR/AcrR family transcriptional regulator [Sneathiella sp.]|jgi:AcrR family transcriptional regulator|uniref:TetR/AcrR family transcriptional regulator n=1 Tax=Sneathiella sp. TaxID=1964365 RepID=UPI0039E63C60